MKNKIVLMLGCFTLLIAQSDVDKIVDAHKVTDKKSVLIQNQINNLSNKKDSLYEEYLNLKNQLDEQKNYNKQLKLITNTQNKQVLKIKQQIKDLEETKKKIIPLIFEMVNTLSKFIKIDIPFNIEERKERINHLKSYMSNPNISVSEKYRVILNAYKIEYSYARTVEVYKGKLNLENKQSPVVNFLRVGRIGFYYQTLDKKKCGMYDLKNHQWVILDEKYNNGITKTINIARKRRAPDFFVLPILKIKDNK